MPVCVLCFPSLCFLCRYYAAVIISPIVWFPLSLCSCSPSPHPQLERQNYIVCVHACVRACIHAVIILPGPERDPETSTFHRVDRAFGRELASKRSYSANLQGVYLNLTLQ